jgi:hypothetical protein
METKKGELESGVGMYLRAARVEDSKACIPIQLAGARSFRSQRADCESNKIQSNPKESVGLTYYEAKSSEVRLRGKRASGSDVVGVPTKLGRCV